MEPSTDGLDLPLPDETSGAMNRDLAALVTVDHPQPSPFPYLTPHLSLLSVAAGGLLDELWPLEPRRRLGGTASTRLGGLHCMVMIQGWF